ACSFGRVSATAVVRTGRDGRGRSHKGTLPMARIFHQQYTRPIPPDAEPFTLKGKQGKPDRPAVRLRGPDGKMVVAPLTRSGDRCRVFSPVWYGNVKQPDGTVLRVPLCENKAAAETMLREKQAELDRAEALGISAERLAARNRPLAE